MRAGKPMIICPFFGDQPFWGRRASELGVAPPPIAQALLTVENLVGALDATDEADLRRSSHKLALRIKEENGVREAVNFIVERYSSVK